MYYPELIKEYWNKYIERLETCQSKVKYESWHFCNDEISANLLAKLVIAGTKTATAGLLWSFEAEGSAIPKIGDLSIITLWDETPVCIIQTTEIQVLPFIEVPRSFAYGEGEGDRTLEYWRKVHMIFFNEECASIGRKPDQTMPIVCERFRVAFRSDDYIKI